MTTQPPKGFRGVFLSAPYGADLAKGTSIPAQHVVEALAAITSSGGQARPPWVGIVVLGRWLGAKPGDSGFGVTGVEAVADGLRVVLASGRLVVRVTAPGDAALLPGAYGELFVIAEAMDVIVTSDGQPPNWLPSVRDGQAFDMRGAPHPWPRRKALEDRSLFAPKSRVPALMLSIANSRPLPEGMGSQPA